MAWGRGGMPSQLKDLCSCCLEEISVLSSKMWFDYAVIPAISTNLACHVMMCSLTKKGNIWVEMKVYFDQTFALLIRSSFINW